MDLLDTIAQKSGFMYLSLLKSDLRWKQKIDEIAPNAFPLKDWNEAVNYLCSVSLDFETAEEAKEYLKKYSRLSL